MYSAVRLYVNYCLIFLIFKSYAYVVANRRLRERWRTRCGLTFMQILPWAFVLVNCKRSLRTLRFGIKLVPNWGQRLSDAIWSWPVNFSFVTYQTLKSRVTTNLEKWKTWKTQGIWKIVKISRKTQGNFYFCRKNLENSGKMKNIWHDRQQICIPSNFLSWVAQGKIWKYPGNLRETQGI